MLILQLTQLFFQKDKRNYNFIKLFVRFIMNYYLYFIILFARNFRNPIVNFIYPNENGGYLQQIY